MNRKRIVLGALFLAILTSPTVWGIDLSGIDTTVVRDLQAEFKNQTSIWFGPLEDIATWLLLSLAVISYAWAAIQMVLRNADLQEFVTELVKMVMFTGFFLALIQNAQEWSGAVIDGFIWSAGHASSAPTDKPLDPAEVMQRGFRIAEAVHESSGVLGYIPFFFVALIIAALYAVIAAYMLLVLAESYIVTAAGVLLLGFGGSLWTSDFAKRYLIYCVSVGAKLYVMMLVVGLGEQFVYRWAEKHADSGDVFTGILILGIVVVIVILVKMVPDMVQGIVNGSSIGSGSPGIAGMAAVAGGIAMLAKTVASTAGGGVGAGKAVSEAGKLASSQLGGDASMLKKAVQATKNLGMATMGSVGDNSPGAGSVAQKLRGMRLGGGDESPAAKNEGSFSAGGDKK